MLIFADNEIHEFKKIQFYWNVILINTQMTRSLSYFFGFSANFKKIHVSGLLHF